MNVRPIVSMLVVTSVVLSAAASTVAQSPAKKKALGKWTCEEFLAVDDQFKPRAVYWATAYAKGGKPEASILDIEGTEQVTVAVIEECKKVPKESFWQKVKGEWRKLEAKVKKSQ